MNESQELATSNGMNKRYFFFGLLIGLGALLFPINHAFASDEDIIFEVPTSITAFGESWNSKIAQRYQPATNQTVCAVEHAVGTNDSSLTNGLVLSVYVVGDGDIPSPETGIKIAETSIPNALIPKLGLDYVSWKFDPCLDLNTGSTYFFVWSRSPLQLSPPFYYGYFSKGYGTDASPRTSYWNLSWQSIWYENPGQDWSFRLRGPSVESQREPVIIIPGIAGTELKNGEDLIWADLEQMFLDINDQFLTENLSLDENGQPVNSEIQVGEVVKRIFNIPFLDVNIFKDLQEKLELEGYSLNQNLFYFPYDWRLDLNDTASSLADKIEQIKSQTGAEKVSVVAHSMGGLLAKEYIAQNGKDSIDKLIFVGTPHLGAPKAGKIIIAGDTMGIPWLEGDRVEEIGENSVAVHELLPNETYFDEIGPYLKNSEGELLDYEQTKQFLIEQGSSSNVFNLAESFFSHNLEDTDFSGIDTYNIVGCNSGTQGGYGLRNDGSIAFTRYRSGDQTVPLVSADGVDILAKNKFYATKGKHAELPSQSGIRNLIADILTGQTLGSYENIVTGTPACKIKGQELIWRSPVEVHILDSQGRHTGPIENNGIEYGIPGVDYEIFGHEKFMFLPTNNGETYEVIAHGLDTGTFDLLVRQNNDGAVTSATVFNDIPVTISTEIKFDITDNILTESIEVDSKGDGNFAPIPVSAFLDDSQADDIIPPTIAIISPATSPYARLSILPIDIRASDNNSGILSVLIEIDGNRLTTSSIDLFFYSLGSHSLDARVTDKAGNTSTASFEFRVVATLDSVISDIERAHRLGWIEQKGTKNSLIQKLKTIIKVEKKIEILGKRLRGNPKVIKRIEKLEKRLDKVLGTAFLKQLEKEYNKGNINEQAYNLLKADIEWLLEK